MKLYEYMGKDLFRRYSIPTPKGQVVTSPEEAAQVAAELGPVVIKIQVLAGKRGKGGGIRFADSPQEAERQAGELFGRGVERLLVEERLKIDQEYYLSLTVDGARQKPLLLASAQGGMDIEEVAEEHIVRYHIDPATGLAPFVGREVARRLGLGVGSPWGKEFSSLLTNLYRLFMEMDCELAEINPLVRSGEQLVAADAKVTIDDEALFRHKDLPYVSDRSQLEERAHQLGLSFVQLDGDIAVMANGAGITMALLDTLQQFGGRPANFLDAGGGTGVETTIRALELLLATNPKAILVNIFGGITRCDDVAKALVAVKEKYTIPVPLVIRLVGTNEEAGVSILKEAGLSAHRDMEAAAREVVALAYGKELA